MDYSKRLEKTPTALHLMPEFHTGPSQRHLTAIQRWQKHFNAKGCSQSKVFMLARKHAIKEIRSLKFK